MRKREAGSCQLLSLSAFKSVTTNWKAEWYIKPKHQLRLKIPGPSTDSIKGPLVSLRRWGQVAILALPPGRRPAHCTDRHTPLCSLGEGRCKTCYAIYTVGRAQHGEGITSSREWSVVNLHSLCNPKALRKFVYVLLLSHSCNFLLHLKPARGEDFWKSS